MGNKSSKNGSQSKEKKTDQAEKKKPDPKHQKDKATKVKKGNNEKIKSTEEKDKNDSQDDQKTKSDQKTKDEKKTTDDKKKTDDMKETDDTKKRDENNNNNDTKDNTETKEANEEEEGKKPKHSKKDKKEKSSLTPEEKEAKKKKREERKERRKSKVVEAPKATSLVQKPKAIANEHKAPLTANSIFFAQMCAEVYSDRFMKSQGKGMVKNFKLVANNLQEQNEWFCWKKKDSERDIYIIAVRGTEDIHDVMDDIQTIFYNAAYIVDQKPELGKVQNPFLKRWKQILEELENQKIELHKDCKIYVTGHSLGGAVATIGAVDILSRGIEAYLYTMGAPPVGDKTFQNESGKLLEDSSWIWVNDADPVPACKIGYHVGRRIHIVDDIQDIVRNVESFEELEFLLEKIFTSVSDEVEKNEKTLVDTLLSPLLNVIQKGLSLGDHNHWEYARQIKNVIIRELEEYDKTIERSLLIDDEKFEDYITKQL